MYGVPIAVAIIAIVGNLPLKLSTKQAAVRGLRISICAALASFSLYNHLLLRYVKCTTQQEITCRTIGAVRTGRAPVQYSDTEILRIHGLEDTQIEQMWTAESIEHARLELSSAAVFAWGALNFAAGCFGRSTLQTRTR